MASVISSINIFQYTSISGEMWTLRHKNQKQFKTIVEYVPTQIIDYRSFTDILQRYSYSICNYFIVLIS